MKKYTIQPGDTLGKIAKQFYNDAGRYVDIVKANNMENPDQISVGMELMIPDVEDEEAKAPETSAGETISDTVATAGETVSGIVSALTAGALKIIMPKSSDDNITKFLDPLNNQMPRFEINTSLRKAHFIAQLAHESGNFKFLKENLNYSRKALRGVFGKYFPDDALAEQYARQPEKIANRVYADRMGNGSEESGDGWKYRGRGLIQLTGRDNYRKCGQELDLPIEESPNLLADEPEYAVAAAGWYWMSRNLNKYADADDVKKVTYRINGGYHGLEDRTSFLERAKSVFV